MPSLLQRIRDIIDAHHSGEIDEQDALADIEQEVEREENKEDFVEDWIEE